MKRKSIQRRMMICIGILCSLLSLAFSLEAKANESSIVQSIGGLGEQKTRLSKNATVEIPCKLFENSPVVPQYGIMESTGRGIFIIVNEGGNLKIGYCLDYGKGMNSGIGISDVSAVQSEYLQSAMTFGYREVTLEPNNIQKAEYVATQVMIWNIMHEIYGKPAGIEALHGYSSGLVEKEHAYAYYAKLMEQMDHYYVLPSFVTLDEAGAREYELGWNSSTKRYEKTVKDLTKTAKQIMLESSGTVGIAETKNAEEYTIYSKETIKATQLIKLRRVDEKAGIYPCAVWGNGDPSMQRVTTLNVDANPTFRQGFLKVKTPLGSLELEKVDSETKRPESQLTESEFHGVKYDLFLKSAYKKGDTHESTSFVRSMIIGRDGRAKAEHIPMGEYYLVERVAPEGYLVDIKAHPVTIPSANLNNPLYTKVTSYEEVIKGDLELVKFAEEAIDKEKEIKDPLEGVEFTITSLDTGAKTVIVTDKDGKATTKKENIEKGTLIYGPYKIEETKGVPGYKTIEPYEFFVNENGTILSYILEDKIIMGALKIQKVDAVSGNVIPIAGTSFQILNEKDEVITMQTYYPKKETQDVFVTDKSGSFLLPEKLPIGQYKLVEISAPTGYLLGEPYLFAIDEGHRWEDPFIISYENTPAKGRFRLEKRDEKTKELLDGAVVQIIAGEDIMTPDGTLHIKGGTVVERIELVQGIGESEPLFLGTYLIEEVKAPVGYKLLSEPLKVELSYVDQNTPLVLQDIAIVNQKVEEPKNPEKPKEPEKPKKVEEVKKPAEVKEMKSVKTGDNLTKPLKYVWVGVLFGILLVFARRFFIRKE